MEPTKEEMEQIFEKLKSKIENKHCFDCNAKVLLFFLFFILFFITI
jgi:hypothetical protein